MAFDKPLKVIHSRTPLRLNDVGGWTDTWFAKQGKILNVAVAPTVEVQIKAYENKDRAEERVIIHAENYGETFFVNPIKPSFAHHAFLQFTISSIPIPEEWILDIRLYSPVPASISTGTSASVCVALLGALNMLAGGGYSLEDLARLAHEVETDKLKQQSGIQDQICAAHGGICYIEMYDYPQARIEKLNLDPATWNELDRRICLVYLGKPHNSSSIHEQVIANLEGKGPECGQLDIMKQLAEDGKKMLLNGDLESYGGIMIRNNECQRAMYSRLISPEADHIAGIAKKHKALGWKVNGAGGQGGSLTILANADDSLRREMLREINSLGEGIRSIPVRLSPTGLTAWEAR